MRVMKVSRFLVMLAAASMVLAASLASADSCKSPRVKVFNDKAQTIKVTRIQYFDGCDRKWRTEDVAATEIAAKAASTFTDNLEYVGNCKITSFKLYRAVRQNVGSAYGAFEWGGELTPDEGSSRVCNTGVTYTIHAHD